MNTQSQVTTAHIDRALAGVIDDLYFSDGDGAPADSQERLRLPGRRLDDPRKLTEPLLVRPVRSHEGGNTLNSKALVAVTPPLKLQVLGRRRT